MTSPRGRRALVLAPFLVLLGGIGCEDCLQRVPAESVESRPYPVCEGGGNPAPVAAFRLRAGPAMREKDVVETYDVEDRGCLYAFHIRQTWSRSIVDVEVLYDHAWKPLRAWKRTILPGPEGPLPPDRRLYELRTEPATMVRRQEALLERWWFRGGSPFALVGPGRGLFSAWVKGMGLDLAVGESRSVPTLDFRALVEKVEPVAIRRDADRVEPGLGRVRVYTFFGRESVFTNDEGWVVGDLAGLRLAETVTLPEPPPVPDVDPPDPTAPLE